LLEKIIVSLPESVRSEYKAVQVKSKFHGLRYYVNDATPEMREIIGELEKKFPSSFECSSRQENYRFVEIW